MGNSRLPADPPRNDNDSAHPPARKATLAQVAATMFWGMCMIGKKGTWERDGVKVSLPQVIVGALIAGGVVVTLLVLLARIVVRWAAH